MKRYKLIKTYPGSPELGTIVMNGIIGVNKGNPNLSFDGSRRLKDYELPHKYPEFWEEIVEKDYEIISYGYDITLRSYIKSVKRLSDGEIFTIGDIINTKVDNKYKQEIIEIIEINLGINDNFFKDKLTFKTKTGFVVIDIAVKSKQPLFTTEDGVDIYERDKYYYVTESGKEVYTIIAKNEKPLSENGKRFSSKKAAENYIFNSEKRFSLDDVIDAIPLHRYDVTTMLSKMLNNLKNLAQTTKE